MRPILDVLEHPRIKRAIELAVGPALLIAIWWVAYKGQLINKDLLPSPFDTLRDTGASIVAGKMTSDFVHTTRARGLFGPDRRRGGRSDRNRTGREGRDLSLGRIPHRLLPLDACDRDVSAVHAAVRTRRFLQDRGRVIRGLSRDRLQRRLWRHERAADPHPCGSLDGRFLASHLQRRDFLRDAAADLCWLANGGFACARRHHRRRNVHRRDRRHRPSHHRRADLLSAHRYVRLDPVAGAMGYGLNLLLLLIERSLVHWSGK